MTSQCECGLGHATRCMFGQPHVWVIGVYVDGKYDPEAVRCARCGAECREPA